MTAMEPEAILVQSFETGLEWVIDASGCDPAALALAAPLVRLFDAFVSGMHLHPAAPAQWHQFPRTGGFTGMLLLMESHLTVHTFPENGTLCLNLFCCRRRSAGDFAAWLHDFHPREVTIRLIERSVSGATRESEPRPSESEPRPTGSGGIVASEVHRSLTVAAPTHTVAAPTHTVAAPSRKLETTR
jgi:S-adenosylmethionine decarboxylase